MKLLTACLLCSGLLLLHLTACNAKLNKTMSKVEATPNVETESVVEEPADENLAIHYFKNRVNILLTDGTTPSILEEEFVGIGLTKMSETSRSQNKWMFSFNKKHELKNVMDRLKNSEHVLEVEMLLRNP